MQNDKNIPSALSIPIPNAIYPKLVVSNMAFDREDHESHSP